MNRRDKDKLFILLILLAYILVTVVFIIGTEHIPWYMLIVILLCTEYFIVQPRICKLYYSACKNKIGVTRFIPFWNEIAMFKPKDAVITLVSYVLLALAIILLFIPSDTVYAIFGMKVMFNYGVFITRAIAIMIIINSICVGIGFMHVMARIKRMHSEFTSGGKMYSTSMVSNILLFIPIVRILALVGMMNVLIKLVNLNNYTVGTKNVDDLLEEN